MWLVLTWVSPKFWTHLTSKGYEKKGGWGRMDAVFVSQIITLTSGTHINLSAEKPCNSRILVCPFLFLPFSP